MIARWRVRKTGQEKYNAKWGWVMCGPGMQKQMTMPVVHANKPAHLVFGMKKGREPRRRAAIQSMTAEVISGARTGPAHTEGMRKRMSQSRRDAGQSRRSFSQM